MSEAPKPADTMFAYVAAHPTSDHESMICGFSPIGRVVACSHDLKHLKDFGADMAKSYANTYDRPVRLVEYHVSREVEIVQPTPRAAPVMRSCPHCGLATGEAAGAITRGETIVMLPTALAPELKDGDYVVCTGCASIVKVVGAQLLAVPAEEFVELEPEIRMGLKRVSDMAKKALQTDATRH